MSPKKEKQNYISLLCHNVPELKAAAITARELSMSSRLWEYVKRRFPPEGVSTAQRGILVMADALVNETFLQHVGAAREELQELPIAHLRSVWWLHDPDPQWGSVFLRHAGGWANEGDVDTRLIRAKIARALVDAGLAVIEDCDIAGSRLRKIDRKVPLDYLEAGSYLPQHYGVEDEDEEDG